MLVSPTVVAAGRVCIRVSAVGRSIVPERDDVVPRWTARPPLAPDGSLTTDHSLRRRRLVAFFRNYHQRVLSLSPRPGRDYVCVFAYKNCTGEPEDAIENADMSGDWSVMEQDKRCTTVGGGGPYTYCPGQGFSRCADVRCGTIVDLCDALGEVFGPGYEFLPEPITEGGIVMSQWPGRGGADDVRTTTPPFKTFRFQMQTVGNLYKWPWITSPRDTLERWRKLKGTPSDQVIWSRVSRSGKVEGRLFYKSFYGAPCWTPCEVMHISDALKSVDFVVKAMSRKRMVRDLESHGLLGVPPPVSSSR